MLQYLHTRMETNLIRRVQVVKYGSKELNSTQLTNKMQRPRPFVNKRPKMFAPPIPRVGCEMSNSTRKRAMISPRGAISAGHGTLSAELSLEE